MSLSNSPILSAATIWPIHIFSSAFLAFLSANILRPRFWRSCNPGPTLQASVTDGSVTLRYEYTLFAYTVELTYNVNKLFLCQASHMVLMTSQNPAYIHLFKENMKLWGSLNTLEYDFFVFIKSLIISTGLSGVHTRCSCLLLQGLHPSRVWRSLKTLLLRELKTSLISRTGTNTLISMKRTSAPISTRDWNTNGPGRSARMLTFGTSNIKTALCWLTRSWSWSEKSRRRYGRWSVTSMVPLVHPGWQYPLLVDWNLCQDRE